jgi:hypothetical protein
MQKKPQIVDGVSVVIVWPLWRNAGVALIAIAIILVLLVIPWKSSILQGIVSLMIGIGMIADSSKRMKPFFLCPTCECENVGWTLGQKHIGELVHCHHCHGEFIVARKLVK